MAGIAWGRVAAEALLLVPYGLFLPRVMRRVRRGAAG
jgi:hypothetical protein